MSTVFLDCSMGAAGDMLSAALLELCPDRDAALARLNAVGIPGVSYRAERAEKCGIAGTRLRVTYEGAEEGGVEQPRHSRGMRLGDIKTLINGLNMPPKAIADAGKIYDMLAAAEAAAHGRPMEHIHFHELGTMDAVADICAACTLMSELSPDRVVCSPVRVGYGTVSCAHGILPVPAPATAALLEGVPVYAGDIQGEMCTPTGAAIIKYFSAGFSNLPAMTVSRVGIGVGMRDFPTANCVRAMLGAENDAVTELCCDVDDMTPEDVGYAVGILRRSGALDVSWQAEGMKKDRPGIRISVLCRREDRDALVQLMFKYTSNIGIRETLCARFVLRRGAGSVETPWGAVRTKVSQGYGVRREKPEYDDIAAIAQENGITPQEIRKYISGGQTDA